MRKMEDNQSSLLACKRGQKSPSFRESQKDIKIDKQHSSTTRTMVIDGHSRKFYYVHNLHFS